MLAIVGLLAAASVATAATTHTISWGNNINAATITIATGDTVTWVLDQQGGHNVISGSRHGVSDGRFSSPWMASLGNSWSHTFTAAGWYPYYCDPHSWMVARVTVVDTPGPTPSPTPPLAPTPPPTRYDYCPNGYGDYGTRFNWAIGAITIASSHQACSDRCTKFSGPQFSGGCKAYMTGMYYGMLLCRSYGGDLLTQPCASFAVPTDPGMLSGALGSRHANTNQVNIGGNCCSNTTFVVAAIG